MKKTMVIIMNVGLIISAIFGLGHFFIPYIFNWYSYMSSVPRYIIVSVDWINFFFSLLLLGNSILLIIYQNQITQKNSIAVSSYGFLLFVYFCKVIITIIEPWNAQYQTIDLIQTTISSIEFILLLLPFIYYLNENKKVTNASKNISN